MEWYPIDQPPPDEMFTQIDDHSRWECHVLVHVEKAVDAELGTWTKRLDVAGNAMYTLKADNRSNWTIYAWTFLPELPSLPVS